MERFTELINELEAETLEYLLTQFTEHLRYKAEDCLPRKSMRKIANEYSLDKEDFVLLASFGRHILELSTAEKNFKKGQKILKQMKIAEEKMKVFEEVFQEQAQLILNQIRAEIPATKNVVSSVAFRVGLPLHDSSNPIKEHFTFNKRKKFKYSDDFYKPYTEITFKFLEDPQSEIKSEPATTVWDKTQLQNLFEETEKIKEHLDSLFT